MSKSKKLYIIQRFHQNRVYTEPFSFNLIGNNIPVGSNLENIPGNEHLYQNK